MTRERSGEQYKIEELKERKMRHEVIAGPVRVLFEVIFGIMHLIFNRINKRRVFRAINSGARLSV